MAAGLLFVVPPDDADAASTTPWEMHSIQEGTAGVGNFDGADGVDLADVDGDGFPDVTSSHEQGYRVSVSSHPGEFGDPEQPWPTLNLPEGDRLAGAEDAVFGRVDADAAVDVVVGTEGDDPHTSVLFGSPNPSDPPTASDWTKVDIRASFGRKAMRVAVADMNDDGTKDILVGEKEGSSTAAKLGYYSPPADPRQPSGWTYHEIGPVGWVMQMRAVDMDGDTDLDVLYSDRDPIDIGVTGTPDRTRMGVRWWENSGEPNPTWTAHQITPERERFHKWFSYVDWNRDGHKDVLDCRSDESSINEIAIWLGDDTARNWTKVPGPDLADAGVGQCQHVTATRIDADAGRDLAATFSHADGRSGVVWWKHTGTSATSVWERNEISGAELGIKYDNLAWTDLDGDGDRDAVTSEQHENTNADSEIGPGLGVIWYENPTVDNVPGPVFDVTDFGATGNDETDDAQAFRDAIAAADATEGSTVRIPAGSYVMDRPSDAVLGVLRLENITDVRLIGEGVSSIVRYRARNWSTGGDPHMFWCGGCRQVSFSDFVIDGAKNDAGFVGQERMHGIHFLDSQNVTVRRMTFRDTFGDGVELLGEPDSTEYVSISDNQFLNAGRSGIGVQGGTRYLEFVGNHFEGTSDQDIDFEPTGTADGRPAPSDILIRGNTIVHATAPASVTIGGQTIDNRAQRVRFLDNEVTHGLVRVYNANDIRLEGNTISGSAVHPAVRIEGKSSGVTVRDNTLEGATPGLPVVQARAHGEHLPGELLIELNRVHQLAADDGIELDQVYGPVVVRDNEVAGSGSNAGVRYRVSVDDGITREAAELSGNQISDFGGAAIAIQALGTGTFGVVRMCGNTVSQQSIGIDLEVSVTDFLGEAVVCDNTWAPEVVTAVRTNNTTRFRGTGSPEGVVTSPVGSTFVRTDEANRVYVKQTGTGPVGWAPR